MRNKNGHAPDALSALRAAPPKNTLFLVGGSESRKLVPWNAPHTDIWVLNLFSFVVGTPRFTAWFDMHQLPFLRAHPRYFAFLRSLDPATTALYTLRHYPEIPASVEYPVDQMVERFGARYFTSGPAYMLALAIDLGYQRIEFYGMAMLTGSEYAYERPCMEWLMGYARKAGIEIIVHGESSLLKADRLYGYEEAYTGVNNNVSPEELVALLGHNTMEAASWRGHLDKLRAYLERLENDPTAEPDFDIYNTALTAGPNDIQLMIGRLTTEKFAITREYNVMLNHIAGIKQGIISPRAGAPAPAPVDLSPIMRAEPILPVDLNGEAVFEEALAR